MDYAVFFCRLMTSHVFLRPAGPGSVADGACARWNDIKSALNWLPLGLIVYRSSASPK